MSTEQIAGIWATTAVPFHKLSKSQLLTLSIALEDQRDRALALVREQAATLEKVSALHKPIKVYDECECPDGTHPEEYEWIDCEDYNGCENSFTHWACEECCTAFDYVTEACSDSHTHSKSKSQRCPTITALEPTP